MTYAFQEITFDKVSLKKYETLFFTAFGGHGVSADVLKWQYDENPIGKAVGFNAIYGNQVVAHYVTIPVIHLINGHNKQGLLSLNTATHPQHQGKGLFKKLANKTYEKGAELGYSFVIGVANHNSVYGFTKKLGFQNLGKLETRLIYNLKLYSQPKELAISSLWSKERTLWRTSHPNFKYYKSNDLIYSDHPRNYLYPLVNHSITFKNMNLGKLPKLRYPFHLWVGRDDSIDWKNSLNLKVPQRFRKIPLTLIFKSLDNDALIGKDVQYWASDFDAY